MLFKPIATAEASDENLESDKTSLMCHFKQNNPCYLQKFQATIRLVPSYQTSTTSKLNKCINKLTLSYFNSFCQSFIPFYYNVCDQ